jgi:hypothetical protein
VAQDLNDDGMVLGGAGLQACISMLMNFGFSR